MLPQLGAHHSLNSSSIPTTVNTSSIKTTLGIVKEKDIKHNKTFSKFTSSKGNDKDSREKITKSSKGSNKETIAMEQTLVNPIIGKQLQSKMSNENNYIFELLFNSSIKFNCFKC